MLISLLCAWMAVICVILTSVKFFTKKNRKVNQFFHKIHIPLGIALVIFGLIHGIFAGNWSGSSILEATLAPELFTLNMGTLSLVLAILLGLSFMARKILKKNWMTLHRVLTVLLVLAVVTHIFQIGITLPSVLLSKFSSSDSTTTTTYSTTGDDLVSFSGATLQDGVYEGSADGYRGTISVSVTVENGAVTDIQVTETSDTDQFFQNALGIIDSILNSQSLEVDTISGATYSSSGILNAVSDALQNAVTDGELQVSEIQVSQTPHHGGPHGH